jgi:competence protein ComEA
MRFFLFLASFIILFFGTTSLAFAAELPTAKESAAKAEVTAPQEAININTADIQQLTRLKGVGEKKAEAIIAWRKENGNFKTVDQLLEVKGIGEAILTTNRENIRI